MKELNAPSFYPSLVSLWINDSFERKDLERELLAKLLVNLCKSQESLLSQSALLQGYDPFAHNRTSLVCAHDWHAN
jgi:translation initiation factor 4G